jgi:hypothetical protein
MQVASWPVAENQQAFCAATHSRLTQCSRTSELAASTRLTAMPTTAAVVGFGLAVAALTAITLAQRRLRMQRPAIKAVLWDMDGVLANVSKSCVGHSEQGGRRFYWVTERRSPPVLRLVDLHRSQQANACI